MLKMLELERHNCGMVCSKEDFLKTCHFELNYEGNGTYFENRNLSGKSDVKEFRLCMFEMVKVVSIFDRQEPFRDYKSACDGETWVIKYYDRKGKLIKTFEGYMYRKEKIEKVISLLYNQVK